MDGYLASMQSLRSFVELEHDLNRQNFEPFAANEVRIHPAILCLEWLPHVSHSGRREYEKTLSAWEGRPVGITRGSSANPRPAIEMADYFPITLMFPRRAAANVIGLNGYSQKDVHIALDQSRDTGEPVSTGKFRVVEHTPDGFAVPIYLPVYRGLKANPSIEDRRRALAGYILAIIELSAALETAIEQVASTDANIQTYDLAAARGQQLLHFHRAPDEPVSVKSLPEQSALSPGPMKVVRQFTLASRPWAIVSTPTRRYLQGNNRWQPWATLAFGLLLSVSLAAYLLLRLSHAVRAESLLGQLFQINGRLNREIDDRKKAEEEISRLNANLEERVTERTEALRESEERYALAARGSKDGLWDWNLGAQTIYFSARWKNMLGYAEGEISSDPAEWLRRLHPDDSARVRAQINSHCAGETPQFQSEHRMLHKDGSYRWMLIRGVAVRDERGRATRMAGSQTDITEEKVADPLTGLPNRIFLAEKLQHAIERSRTSRSHLFAVLFLDLDRFKIINDSLGHKAGDLLLRSIAVRLLACRDSAQDLPERIVVARLGGDEFAVLLQDIPTSQAAGDFAEAIKSAMKPAFEIAGRQIFASCSVGIALGGPDSDADELLGDADTAMYHAKSQGKQRYEIFDAHMRQRAMERMQLEIDLRSAVPRGELFLHYQPKISLVTGNIVEFEALVRWNHPVRGIVLPASFIPLADETGIINAIGEWVLLEACRQLAAWRKSFHGPIGVSVNISARQFETSELVGQVQSILSETGLPPGSLSLEITESLLLENPETAHVQLGELRALGVGLKIDDFGTGFSSLSTLHRLPFNELKIDRSFIAGFGVKPETTHIVHTIILLARLLNMKVVAEGVESEEQVNQLSALSCDYAQGNFFSPPLAPSLAEGFLSTAFPSFFPAAQKEAPPEEAVPEEEVGRIR